MTKDQKQTEQAVSDLEEFKEWFEKRGVWPRCTSEEIFRAGYSAALSQVRGKAQEPVAWTAAVEKAVQDAAYVFKDSCNHTAQAIDYMKAVLHEAAPQGAQEEGARELAKYQPCGCVICTCEDDYRCRGCGARHCGTHPVGQLPNPLYAAPQSDAQQSSEKDADALIASMKAFADAQYAAGCRVADSYECKGWEAKVQSGRFGKAEMDAHAKMQNHFGAHSGIYAAINAALAKESGK